MHYKAKHLDIITNEIIYISVINILWVKHKKILFWILNAKYQLSSLEKRVGRKSNIYECKK